MCQALFLYFFTLFLLYTAPSMNKLIFRSMNMTAEDRKALRDLFASQALVGLTCYYEDYEPHEIAFMAYEVADAMMKARENDNEK